MFSTAVPIPSTSYRNPRRRQRPLDDTANHPRAKRQRSLLRDDEFQHHVVEEQSDVHSDIDEAEDENGMIPSEPTSPAIRSSNGIPLRGPKKIDNGGRIHAPGVLVNNDYYSIAHLPSLPDKVKETLRVPFRCVISPDTRYCLALTRENAIVWLLPSASAPSTPDDVSVLSFPNSSAHSSDLLPLGTLISVASHSQPGLLVVVPSTGEIIFWETVSNPTILGLIRQKQSAFRDVIPGLLSGEYAIEIVNVEPAGVILILSTGRLGHVSTRDSQGKPGISFQFLNGTSRSTGGGLLAGIKNVLSSASWRRNVVAAKAGKSYRRGQRALVVATTSGLIELWDIHWSNGGFLKTHADVIKAISKAFETNDSLGNYPNHAYQLVDLTFREDTENYATEPEGGENQYALWILVSVTLQQDATSYFLVGVDFHGLQVSVDRIYQLPRECSLSECTSLWTPRIYVPKPGNTGFVVFKTGFVLLSLAPFQESPSSQLLLGGESIPAPFQDYIRFRNGNCYAVIGCGLEFTQLDQQNPSCLVMVQNFGLIRISAHPRSISLSGVDEGRIPTKSRLEQVIFYDAESSPIDLTCYAGLHESPSVLEDAALQISNEVLRSSSKFVPTTIPSLDEQMKLRSAALHALATYVKEQHLQLSYATRWTLLSHAEKMAAHRAIWKAQENISKNSTTRGSRLEYILGQMGERFTTKPDPDAGEDDVIRYWFLHDTWRMEYIIPWILHGIQDTSNDGMRVDEQFVCQIWQASELSLAALETVFRYRAENESLYGLEGHRPDMNGAPVPNDTRLPAIWTAEKINYSETERLLDAELNTCLQLMRQTGPRTENSDQHALAIMERIKQNSPKTLKVLWQLYMERVHRCISQSSANEQDSGRELQKSYMAHRKTHLYKMAAMGLLEESVALAEDFHDMDALVELVVEMENRIGERHPAGAGDPRYDTEMASFQLRIDKYFHRFGASWATPFYTRQILAGHPETLLLMTPYQEHITRFLRDRPSYAKLGWMNEVLGERDYDRASKSLIEYATNYESSLWNKQVELAIGKLSRLATLEDSETQDLPSLQTDIKRFDDLSELARIQEMLYEHIAPVVHGAIDQSAELQLANEQLGKIVVHSKPALGEALRRGLAKLVAKCPAEPDELVDILTLIDPICVTESEDGEIVGHEFSLALRVLNLSDLSRQDPEYCRVLEKIIWRRCMIRDDWDSINSTKQKGDREVKSAIQSTALFKTLEDIKGFENEPDISSRLYAPSDVTDTDIFPHRLASRLLPENRARLSEDLGKEATLLCSYIEKDRLDDWYSWIVSVIWGKSSQSALWE
ncbi:hypothetical protein PRK78_001052 [Emydomyces testavorans]|uniref:Nuclear pore complex protein Nup133 n=1 Tax=Emydomyces testavorans TaxID=2070801 RepID=A0AAF0DBV2_9EURO|nr:hypothetical protein PRK78_001052 [Emydomyces testavorans]